jgi:hypothetical protein
MAGLEFELVASINPSVDFLEFTLKELKEGKVIVKER